MAVERALFLAGAFLTHAFVGYTLVRGVTDADPRIGLLVGVVPDADFLFPATWGWPLVHRGLTHTPIFALLIIAGTCAIVRDRTAALAVALAIGSHLVIDSLSPAGIAWLYPLEASPSPGIPVHGPVATAGLWIVTIGILVRQSGAISGLWWEDPW